MAVRLGGGFMAPFCFLEQTSRVNFEVAYFLPRAWILNYHGVNDWGQYRALADLTSINFRDKGIDLTVSMK